jgi:biopolymer transport protein ExbB
MIKVFAAIMQAGVGDPAPLAGGISEALITTAAGLTVAIPSFFFYRYFRGKIRAYVVGMEQLALDLINTIEHGNRELRRSEMGWG